MGQQARFAGTGQALNPYGDHLFQPGGQGFGGEISYQREDELDQMALKEACRLIGVLHKRKPVVYDIGCGWWGAMSVKFAKMGCLVVACDIQPMPFLCQLAQDSGTISPEHILQEDARNVDWAVLPAPDILYSQRFLHYLRFQEAVALLRVALSRAASCLAYLSMSGVHSELSDGYNEEPLESRFGHLSTSMAKKHGVSQEVCLYSLDDAKNLAVECDLEIVHVWLSEFGNVKMLAKR